MGQHRPRRRRGRGHRARRGLATPQGRTAEPAARCGQARQHRGPRAAGGAGAACVRAQPAGQAPAPARQATASGVTPAARTRALDADCGRAAGGCTRRAAGPTARATATGGPERQRPRGARVRCALGVVPRHAVRFAGESVISAFAFSGAPRWLRSARERVSQNMLCRRLADETSDRWRFRHICGARVTQRCRPTLPLADQATRSATRTRPERNARIPPKALTPPEQPVAGYT
jgi:hypothetical protein